MDDNKKRALTAALSQIEKQFGKGAVMRMGDRPNDPIDTVSTGSLGPDTHHGNRGLPRCRSGKLSRYGDWTGAVGRGGANQPMNRRMTSGRCGIAMMRGRIRG